MLFQLNLHSASRYPIKFHHCYNKIKVSTRHVEVHTMKVSHTNFLHDEDKVAFEEEDFITFQAELNHKDFCLKVEVIDDDSTLGVGYVIHSDVIKSSTGTLVVKFIDSNFDVIGEGHFDYICVWKWQEKNLNLGQLPYLEDDFLYIGHRGCGSTNDGLENLENTIQSFKKCFESGASFIELDVQLTKDLQPVVFHDFYVSIATTKKNGEEDRIDVPICQLTLSQLQHNKIDLARSNRDNKCMSQNNVLAPALGQVISELSTHGGILVEVKYPFQEQHTGKWEMEDFFDRNTVVDKTLDVIMKYTHCNIVLCSFDADICLMLRYKQSQFPVMLCTCGENENWHYMDMRNRTRDMAANYVIAHGLSGVSITGDPLRNSLGEYKDLVEKLKARGKHVFSWGSKNTDPDYRELQRKIGVTGVIFDGIDKSLINRH